MPKLKNPGASLNISFMNASSSEYFSKSSDLISGSPFFMKASDRQVIISNGVLELCRGLIAWSLMATSGLIVYTSLTPIRSRKPASGRTISAYVPVTFICVSIKTNNSSR